MTREDLAELNWEAEPLDRVCELATLAQQSGMDGVVCSAAEASVLKRHHGGEFLMVTPGIRQAGDAVGDQRRVVTPSDAIAAGATHIVVGRSITASPTPPKRCWISSFDVAACRELVLDSDQQCVIRR